MKCSTTAYESVTSVSRKIRGVLGVISLAGSLPLSAQLDLDRSGISDLWEQQYPTLSLDEADEDKDGVSNRNEALAGTDPLSADHYLNISDLQFENDVVNVFWDGVAGKAYRLEQYDADLKQWQSASVLPPVAIDGPRVAEIPVATDGVLIRLVVRDFDSDGDGLTAWEESQLGWSDADVGSSGDPARGDYVIALRMLESSEGLVLADGTRLDQQVPDENGAARFLQRASFGPTEESIAEVTALGYSGWIDQQLNLPVSTLETAIDENGLTETSSSARHAWWRLVHLAEDQLRQRMAYALSQIMVVNFDAGSRIGDIPLVQAKYYDFFVNGAFGSYRDILEKVTYSPAMGFYLSHLKNRKTDDPENPTRFPDENFAREIMQLFTIGLWELNPDGSRKLDDEGEFIPTYDNDTISETAKVFTGLSFSTKDGGFPASSFFNLPLGADYFFPMKVWEEEHEPGVKEIVGGVILDGTQTGEEEIQTTLDVLTNHESAGPFLSRLLIQRLTASNPSPAYLARVTRAWNGQVPGSKGNLRRVAEAILLDPDVLTPSPSAEYSGKVREPILRYTSLTRAFNLRPENGKFAVDHNRIRDSFGQFPMLSPTVFNFYLPDFAPAGKFRNAGRVSPELQLATMSQMISSDARFSITVEAGHFSAPLDYTEEIALSNNSAALVDRVDLLLTGRRLTEETRQAIIAAVKTQLPGLRRVRTAVYLVTQSMECITLN